MIRKLFFQSILLLTIIACQVPSVVIATKEATTPTPLPVPTYETDESTQVCPEEYHEFETPHLAIPAGDETRAIMVSDDGIFLTVILDKTLFSTENMLPETNREVVLVYVYNNTTYRNVVGNYDGILCYTDSTIEPTPIVGYDGLRSLEQNRAAVMEEFVGLNVIIAVSDENDKVGVIIEGNVVVAQALKPESGYQVEFEFNVGSDIFTVVVINDNGNIAYRLKVEKNQTIQVSI